MDLGFKLVNLPRGGSPTQPSEDPEYAIPVEIEVTDVFDLHSVPPRDVAAVVEAYLEEARRLEYTAIRIVHGRGIGVQRERVRAILAKTPFVKAFADAPAEAGGWGATIADLEPRLP